MQCRPCRGIFSLSPGNLVSLRYPPARPPLKRLRRGAGQAQARGATGHRSSTTQTRSSHRWRGQHNAYTPAHRAKMTHTPEPIPVIYGPPRHWRSVGSQSRTKPATCKGRNQTSSQPCELASLNERSALKWPSKVPPRRPQWGPEDEVWANGHNGAV